MLGLQSLVVGLLALTVSAVPTPAAASAAQADLTEPSYGPFALTLHGSNAK
jgi:hypothetical protein